MDSNVIKGVDPKMWPKSHVKVFNGPTTKKDLVDKGVDRLKDKNMSAKNSQNTINKSKKG